MTQARTTALATAFVVGTGTLWGLYWVPVRRLGELGLAGAWGTLAIVAAGDPASRALRLAGPRAPRRRRPYRACLCRPRRLRLRALLDRLPLRTVCDHHHPVLPHPGLEHPDRALRDGVADLVAAHRRPWRRDRRPRAHSGRRGRGAGAAHARRVAGADLGPAVVGGHDRIRTRSDTGPVETAFVFALGAAAGTAVLAPLLAPVPAQRPSARPARSSAGPSPQGASGGACRFLR